MRLKNFYCLLVIYFAFFNPSIGQKIDSSRTIIIQKSDTISRTTTITTTVVKKKKFYQTGLFKAVIVPSVLIGWGVSTIHDHGLYSSYDAYHDIHKLGFKRTHVDDYLQYSPYIELIGLNLINVRCKNDLLNTTLLVIKSELIMNAIIWPVKSLAKEVRPDSINPGRDQSFPSGHTANAFLAASLVHKEFKHRSPWYGITAYAIATSVGVFRMLNNRHWESDVFVGAGVGMLSVHLAYLTHRNRWGRKCSAFIMPTYQKGNVGLCYIKRF